MARSKKIPDSILDLWKNIPEKARKNYLNTLDSSAKQWTNWAEYLKLHKDKRFESVNEVAKCHLAAYEILKVIK